MDQARALLLCVCLTILASCATVQNPIYQPKAAETRGGRTIAATIDLVSEVGVAAQNGQPAVIGVFYLRETFQDGGAQAVLLSPRGFSFFMGRTGTIQDYDLRETSSLTLDQARQLLGAMDNLMTTDPKSVPPTRMLSFEMDSGTLDMAGGNDRARPLKEVNLVVAFSVTNAAKSFRMVFAPTVGGAYSGRPPGNQTFELNEDQVKKLRDAIAAAAEKATPRAAP